MVDANRALVLEVGFVAYIEVIVGIRRPPPIIIMFGMGTYFIRKASSRGLILSTGS